MSMIYAPTQLLLNQPQGSIFIKNESSAFFIEILTGFISVTVWLIFIHNFFFAGVAIALLVHEVEELGLLSDTTWNQYFSKLGCCVTLSKYFLL